MLASVISSYQKVKVQLGLLTKLCKITGLSCKVTKPCEVAELLHKMAELCNVIDNKSLGAKS